MQNPKWKLGKLKGLVPRLVGAAALSFRQRNRDYGIAAISADRWKHYFGLISAPNDRGRSNQVFRAEGPARDSPG
jgi:hypothetical protein